MSLQAAKLTIVQKILAVEQASVLERIAEILDKEMIVGYTTDGKPLTKKAYNKRIAIAEKQLKNGDTTSQEDLEKESEGW